MFRFTIRDVLWLTFVVALAAGWWVHAKALSAENLAVRRQFEICKFERQLDCQHNGGPSRNEP